MKLWSAILLGAAMLTCTAARADWHRSLPPYQPGSFAPMRPIRAQYTFGWSALTAAEAQVDISRPSADVYQFKLKAGTVGAVRPLWRMDGDHTSTMQAASFRPLRLDQKEVYRDETRRTQLSFTPGAVTRTREITPEKGKAEKKTKTFEFADLVDLHTAMHFVRSQPLRMGDAHKLVVYPSTSPYFAEVKVLGTTNLKAAGKNYRAIKSDLKLWKIDDDDLELKPHTKFKRATIWLSDDRDRLLLRVEGEIFVGKVWAELESVEFTTP